MAYELFECPDCNREVVVTNVDSSELEQLGISCEYCYRQMTIVIPEQS